MPRTPCCCGCNACSSGSTNTLQSGMTVTNNTCNSSPGCGALGGDKVMTRGANGLAGNIYIPAVLPFDDSAVCYYYWINPDPIECSTVNCDACGCTGEFTKNGNVCDPEDPVSCDDEGEAVIPSSACGDCEAEGCTTDCNLDNPAPHCNCISDGLGGYVCDCDTACSCATDCPSTAADSFRKVWIYLSEDETEVVVYTEVGINGEIFTGIETYSATGGKIDCSTIGSVTLTSETPGSQTLCDAPTSIDFEYV